MYPVTAMHGPDVLERIDFPSREEYIQALRIAQGIENIGKDPFYVARIDKPCATPECGLPAIHQYIAVLKPAPGQEPLVFAIETCRVHRATADALMRLVAWLRDTTLCIVEPEVSP